MRLKLALLCICIASVVPAAWGQRDCVDSVYANIKDTNKLRRLGFSRLEISALQSDYEGAQRLLATAESTQQVINDLELLEELSEMTARQRAALQEIRDRLQRRVDAYRKWAKSDTDDLDSVARVLCAHRGTSAPPERHPLPPTEPQPRPRQPGYADLVKVVLGEPTSDMRQVGDGVYMGKNSWPSTYRINDGRIEYNGPPLHATFTWNRLPQTIGRDGFDLEVTTKASSDNGRDGMATGINVKGYRVELDPGPASFPLSFVPGGNDSRSDTVRIKPAHTLEHGQEFTIEVGAFYGPIVTYTYRVR